jgi:Domain of unknown function (DUF6438)
MNPRHLIFALALSALPRLSVADDPSPVLNDPHITSILMHRSACFGFCPVYTVEVLSNGEVRFNGEDHVKLKGRHVAHIAPAEFGVLLQAIERFDFFSLNEQYRYEPDGCTEWWTDNPTVDIVVTRSGSKKRVSYYYGCRGIPAAERIDALSKEIDKVANSTRWIGHGDAF